MSLPLANQVRNLYVVTSKLDSGTPSTLGQLTIEGEVGKSLYFKHFGQGGLTSSDKINVENIRYVKKTAGADLNDKLYSHTIKVDTVEAGQIYEVKLRFLNYIGQGAQDFTYRLGTYRAKTGDNAAAIATGLATSLQLALGLKKNGNPATIEDYKEPIATVTVSGDTITVSEVDQYWELGKFPVAQMPIEVSINGIVSGDDYINYSWATITPKASNTSANNAVKKIADLEYFCMGNRADQYRGMGWPRTAESKLMVDLGESYDLIDIHYFFQGTGVSVQQSEKEITLVCKSSESAGILTAINTKIGTPAVANNEGFPKTTV